MILKNILLSSESVRAILGGSKTQARQIVKPQPKPSDVSKIGGTKNYTIFKTSDVFKINPKFNIDDILWVRETWCRGRLFLKVTDINIERLNDISIEDCISEGIDKEFDTYLDYATKEKLGSYYLSAKDSFKSLWAKENGKKSWYENPFVYALKFNRIDKPENFN